jgi:hypothetical protein
MYSQTNKILALCLVTIVVHSFSTLDIDEEYVSKKWSTL